MKKIKSFKLFESYSIGAFGINDIDTMDQYISSYASAKSGIARANFYKDFKNWVVYKAYELLLREKSNFPLDQSHKSQIESLVKYPIGYNDDFNYEKIVNNIDASVEVDKLITTVSKGLKICDAAKSVNDKPIKDVFVSSVKNSIENILDDIFWPGNMGTIRDLKYLDAFGEEQRENLGINYVIKQALDKTCTRYSTMEKNVDSLGKKFMNLLTEIGKAGIKTLTEMDFPDVIDDAVINYFNKSEDSFKVADEIRKGNIPLYNKIKELMPNIDTAADLGDLGF
jgi:hypothetical protein